MDKVKEKVNVAYYINKKVTPQSVVVIFILLIGGVILFINPIIGVADNGDFYRIISQNGVYNLNPNDSNMMFGYFAKDYGIYKYANEISAALISTQSIFIKLAVKISQIFNKNYILDIRFLSFIFLSIHTIAGYLLVKVFTKDLKYNKHKYFIVALYIFIFCDIGYIAYFNSFYGEAVMISCFLLSVGILLYMFEFNKINIITLILFAIASFLFFGAKQQLAPIGLLIAIVFIRIGLLDKRLEIKIISGILSVLFIINAVFLYKSIEGDFDYMNRFHAMTRGTILNGENPEEVLNKFGIDGSYSLLKGANFYEAIPNINPNDERLKENFYNNYSTLSILIYYIKNPKEFIKILKIGIENSYVIRPEAMGNYEKSSGKSYGEKSYFFSGWSTIKNNYVFRNNFFTIVFIIIFFLQLAKRYNENLKNRNIMKLLMEEGYLYIFLAGFSQIVISVVGAGDADLSKHEFLYNLSFDLMIIYIVVNYLKVIEVREIGK